MSKEVDTVFVVRDVEERYLKGVYRHFEDAEACIEEYVTDASVGMEDAIDDMAEYADIIRANYEILEMPLE